MAQPRARFWVPEACRTTIEPKSGGGSKMVHQQANESVMPEGNHVATSVSFVSEIRNRSLGHPTRTRYQP